ncbi:MAG: TRAP transporter 4TM/12TM fusion protein [Alphaproteobacteria bacterium]|jgi:TRAP transporter 4TM/12TM fusion protein
MSADQNGTASDSGEPAPNRTAEDLVAQVESGPRSPNSRIAVGAIIAISVAWSVYQLYIAQNPINSFIARSWHLGFALSLVFLAYPAYDYHNPPRWVRGLRAILPFLRKARPNREYIPPIDIVLAIVATAGALFIWWDFEGIITRQGLPSLIDVIMGVITLVLLLEAARRCLGPALSIICMVFIAYAFVGPYMPDILRHRGIPLDFFINDMYMSTTGIFGVPLGVSTSFVFLFVLFGTLLDRAGAGKYFIDVAFAGLGHKTGGPAKAAVVASGLSGLVSGSSIANVVTTGTFTIPLMKKVGLPAYKAAAIEVAASTNGQLMPPIMGAAAFIMADLIGIPYLDVVRAALFPAIISYMALFYVVHLEALKLNLRVIPKSELPPLLKTFLNGLHYLVPLITLIYFLVIVRRSPIFSALTAIEALAVIMIIQRPIIAYLALGAHKRAGSVDADARLWPLLSDAFLSGLMDIWQGLIAGARSMMSVGVATAAAGIIVGVVTSTGLTGRFTALIEQLAGGNVVLMLVFTAITSLILGMGLPTTANYILMASLTAPVIVELGGNAGLIFPVVAAHLFVFYFGILADDTPPVGLAAYAGAAIAGSDPIKTGIQGFTYDMRTAILPFVFIFNTELLMISGVAANGDIIWLNNIFMLAWVFFISLFAIFAFASFMQGFFADDCNWPERLLLLAVSILMFRPALVSDEIDVPRQLIQAVAVAIYFALYFYQKRRRKQRGPGEPLAQAG